MPCQVEGQPRLKEWIFTFQAALKARPNVHVTFFMNGPSLLVATVRDSLPQMDFDRYPLSGPVHRKNRESDRSTRKWLLNNHFYYIRRCLFRSLGSVDCLSVFITTNFIRAWPLCRRSIGRSESSLESHSWAALSSSPHQSQEMIMTLAF